MKDCLFCKIGKGEIPAKTIYEDEKIKIFMDINPTTNGHLLIIPKKHYLDVEDIDINIINHSLTILKEKIIPLLKEKLNMKGFTIIQNNGIVQEVKHYHIHIVPRYGDDDVKHIRNEEKLIDVEEIYKKLTSD